MGACETAVPVHKILFHLQAPDLHGSITFTSSTLDFYFRDGFNNFNSKMSVNTATSRCNVETKGMHR